MIAYAFRDLLVDMFPVGGDVPSILAHSPIAGAAGGPIRFGDGLHPPYLGSRRESSTECIVFGIKCRLKVHPKLSAAKTLEEPHRNLPLSDRHGVQPND
jgi:hypothetical protein